MASNGRMVGWAVAVSIEHGEWCASTKSVQ